MCAHMCETIPVYSLSAAVPEFVAGPLPWAVELFFCASLMSGRRACIANGEQRMDGVLMPVCVR